MSFAAVFITASGRKEAEKLSRMLVGEKLAACVNMLPALRSRYRWKGRIETASEVLLIAKTRRSLVSRLVRRVKAAHSYGVPEVIALPILAGNPDYLRWIKSST